VAGQTLLQHSIDTLGHWEIPFTLVVVVPEGWVEPARAAAASLEHTLVVTGGSTRTQSVRHGLAALPKGTTIVLIHDAARPLMPLAVFDRVRDAVVAGAVAVIPCVAVVDTLVTRDRETGVTVGGVDREVLGAVQTPQGFDAALLGDVYRQATGDFTDDAALMRDAGYKVTAINGDPHGFKITFAEDLHRARALLGTHTAPRVGTALDVHAFDDTAPLRLAGLVWPGEKGLAGHSDGDVAVHAIVDALLQAASLGDLGTHFGTDRVEFQGANSTVFLEHALALVRAAGFEVSSVGVQIIGNSPKVGPRRREAEGVLTALVGAPVAVSATTSDALGFTGRGEGIAALATVVLSEH
jgi:2-C-methyl-D-erythritol 4-phosphate cytidylyltransferase/2-C-methyl-D-erythritol 2,4-cyclodiphosphate synthase